MAKRELFAGPETAGFLRAAYDLEVTSSCFVDEGQVFIIPVPDEHEVHLDWSEPGDFRIPAWHPVLPPKPASTYITSAF